MTRALYAWIFDTLSTCEPFARLVQSSRGLRRMDTADLAEYQKIVCFGRLTRGPLPGYPTRPLFVVTVTFTEWVRPDLDEDDQASSGDLILEDLEDRILRALVIRDGNPVANQRCFPNPPLLVLDAAFDGDVGEPGFDEAAQAWTKSFRLRFIVAIATCQPVAPWCGPCESLSGAVG